MSDKKRRGRGVPEPTGFAPALGVMPGGEDATYEQWNPPPDVPRRHLVQVSTTVFIGYAFLTDEKAYELQDQLTAMSDVTGTVYLRATQRTEPTDYLDVESVIADIRLAIPAKK